MLAVSPRAVKRPDRVPPFNECPAKMLSELQVGCAAKRIKHYYTFNSPETN